MNFVTLITESSYVLHVNHLPFYLCPRIVGLQMLHIEAYYIDGNEMIEKLACSDSSEMLAECLSVIVDCLCKFLNPKTLSPIIP